MLTRELHKQQVLQCGEQLKKLIPPDIEEYKQLMKKGLLLYRQGLVYNVNVYDSMIQAKVQDVTPVTVKLDLDYVTLSECSCPSSFPCRHVIATFLYVYALTDRLGSFLDVWKEDNPSRQLKKLKDAGLILKGTVNQEASISSWYQYFEQEFLKELQETLSTSAFIQTIYYQFYPKVKRNTPYKQELKSLYHFHAALFTLQKILQSLNETHVSEFLFQKIVLPIVDELRDTVLNSIYDVKRVAHSFSLETFLYDSMEKVRDILFCSSYYRFERLTIYRQAWIYLFKKSDWVNEEKNIIHKRLKEELEKQEFLIECDIARMHLQFLEGDDKLLLERLESFAEVMIPYSFDWIGEVTRQKDWNRFKHWASYLLNHIDKYLAEDISYAYKRNSTNFLLKLFKDYQNDTEDDELFEKACETMLPFSYAEYHIFLKNRDDYRKCVELQQIVGFHFSEIELSFIKELEKKEPEKLLPLLHSEIHQLILEKNRSSYKQAVKYLKQLKRVYKKLKRVEVWENYFQKLVSEHNRLRAFKEELKKGKLLDA